MGATARQQDAPDGGCADPAGLAGAQINAVFELKKSPLALGVHIVGDRRTAETDGMAQYLPQRLAQPLQLVTGEAAGSAARTNPGPEEALVGIDVAHSGEQILVEQSGLDGELAAPEEGSELVAAYGQWFGPRRGEGGTAAQVAELKAAEAARIDKTQLPTAGQSEAGMGMGLDGSIGGTNQQPPGHPQVHDPLRLDRDLRKIFRRERTPDRSGRAELADDVFAGTVHREKDAALKPVRLLGSRSLEGLAVRTKPSRNNAVAAHARIDTAGDSLHLRKLRHRIIVDERLRSGGHAKAASDQPT